VSDKASAVVACVSAIVALASAVYARWQVSAAERANKIALHENCLCVYKALGRFRVHITSRGKGIKEEEVWQFFEAAEVSEFYFSDNVHARLQAVFDQSLKILSLNEQAEDARQHDPDKARSLAKEAEGLMRKTRDECYKLTDELKPFLRVGTETSGFRQWIRKRLSTHQ
jgi:hypothetical protein